MPVPIDAVSPASSPRILDEVGRTEFPFPDMDAKHSSSSDTLPSAPGSWYSSSRTKSDCTSPSPSPSRERYDSDRGFSRSTSTSRTKFFVRLLSRDARDLADTRSLLAATTTRLAATSAQLASETARADGMQARVLELVRRLRTAQAETTRAETEISMYKMRLAEAEGELQWAQETLDRVEQERVEAEEAAERAKSVARKWREEAIGARAREEGRREGFGEGLARARNGGWYQPAPERIRAQPGFGRRSVIVEQDTDNEGDGDSGGGSGSQPDRIISIERSPPQPRRLSRPPSSIGGSVDNPSGTRTSASPSPIRIRPPQSPPIPVSAPGPVSLSAAATGLLSSHPISPPPSNALPFADAGHPSAGKNKDVQHEQPARPVRARDFAHPTTVEAVQQTSTIDVPMSFTPQSHASTNISQFDLLSRHETDGRSHGSSMHLQVDSLRQMIGSPASTESQPRRKRPARVDVRVLSPRGPRPMDDLSMNADHPTSSDAEPPHNFQVGESSSGSSPDRLSHKRNRNSLWTSTGSGVPEIVVESPTTASASRTPTTATDSRPQTHLLSPEYAPVSLPESYQEDATNTHASGRSYGGTFNPGGEEQETLPPLPDIGLATTDAISLPAPMLLEDGHMPPGFVPFPPPSPYVDTAIPDKATSPPPSTVRAEREQRPKRPATYATAPAPPGLVYPDSFGAGEGRAGRRGTTPMPAPGSPPLSSASSGSTNTRRRRGDGVGGYLSPLSLRGFTPLRA